MKKSPTIKISWFSEISFTALIQYYEKFFIGERRIEFTLNLN